jgi:hypothetical protein
MFVRNATVITELIGEHSADLGAGTV